MARNLDPKCKQCRRLGDKLFLKGERCNSAKCGIVKRNFPPGVHGSKGRTRQTEFGLQLAEKQKAMKEYRMLEKQFHLTFEKAQEQSGDTGENFLRMLESRLDNVVYRLAFTESRDKARQLVNHGHFTVNGKTVTIPSFIVKVGDIVAIKESSKKAKVFANLSEKVKKQSIPGWLNLDAAVLSGKVLNLPKKDDLALNLNPQMIVEFYSR
ncbi:30S ribosomal protein S4 [Candidatus Falkowbacteria bacterium]|nr:30S ribosomal protein S4 [Candidatus Falkowbacteria bacterium]